MSTMKSKERALRQRLKDDFEFYASNCLKVRAKAGAIQAFNLNASQRYLHERLEKQLREKGKVRALVLKGRQIGVSTYIAGRFYWKVSHRTGRRVFILTHRDDATNNLFDFAKRFHNSCPEQVRPQTGSANAKELNFAALDSGYKVATAGGYEIGRSDTIQFFHGSEMAFWPNADMHDAGIGQAIADAAETEDIRESTANGIGNAFYTAWKMAERGDSEYEPIFIPWFWHEEYQTEPQDGWVKPQSFADYQALHGLTDAQIHWAWRKNRDMLKSTGGDPNEFGWKFRQEYPATAAEAFQTSGDDSFIPVTRIEAARKAKVEGFGPLILGVDPARGGGDKTGLVDRQGRRLGGHICECVDSDNLMETAGYVHRKAVSLKEHGLAKVVVDTTGLGAGLYDRLRELLGADLVEGVNFGSAALAFEIGPKGEKHRKFENRRAEIWDEMRIWFDDPAGVQVPDRDDVQGDLAAPVWGKGATRFNSNSVLQLESKDHIRERLGFSPDIGDAAALTFAVNISNEARAVNWDAETVGGDSAWLM